MKLLVLSFLVWVIPVLTSPVEKRQDGTSSLWGALGTAPLKPALVDQAEPQLRKTAKRSIVRYGPFELPAMNTSSRASGHSHGGGAAKPMDPNGVLVSKMIEGICKDCTVLSGRMEITYEDGSQAGIDNGVYLHHVLVMDPTKHIPGEFAPWCPGNLATMTEKQLKHPVKSVFLSGGVEHFTTWYTTPDGKFDSGYYVKQEGGPFAMSAEIVNYKDVKQSVYITADYEWVEGRAGDDALSTLLSVTGCGKVGYRSSKPQNNVTSSSFPILSDGTIINARGHMHDGGSKILLYLNDKPICTSVASYGGVAHATAVLGGKKWETISKMSDCTEPIDVKRGDQLKMESIYDLESHPLRESNGEEMEEMGIYTFTFVPTPKT